MNENETANTVKITVKDNGPLRVEGTIELVDGSGKAFDLGGRTAISLCRCAQSKNLPFCDGTHGGCGFESKVEARALPRK